MPRPTKPRLDRRKLAETHDLPPGVRLTLELQRGGRDAVAALVLDTPAGERPLYAVLDDPADAERACRDWLRVPGNAAHVERLRAVNYRTPA